MYETTVIKFRRKLFQHAYISNRSWLENTIHTNFIECGKSGKLLDKQKNHSKFIAVQNRPGYYNLSILLV